MKNLIRCLLVALGLSFTIFSHAQTYYLQSFPAVPYPFDPYYGTEAIEVLDASNRIYLIQDSGEDFGTLQEMKSMGRMSMESSGFDDSDSGEGFNFTFDTNSLWLEVANVANGLAYVNLHNASNYVYEIYSKTDLAAPVWSIETEVFPTDVDCMPFTVSQSERTNLFLWARDWTGITSGGNTTPEWWFYYFYGRIDLSDTNLDSVGNTLLYDFQNDLDPNPIQFSLQFSNDYVNTNFASGTIMVSSGVPFYMAVLVNDTNLAGADWQPYTSSNVIVTLGSTDGAYKVFVGLRGLPQDAQQTWAGTTLTRDTVPPVLVVTNPVAGVVSMPMIQLQGYVSESLSRLTFDVSNAAGIWTNQTGYAGDLYYDTNLLAFTTNWFQCYDVRLTNGLNTITLHATDLAGNQATTNISYTLDYSSDTTPPSLVVNWPADGTPISGSNFVLQAQVNDPTAIVTAKLVDADGHTNTASGLVERNGLVWLNNLPLGGGTNTLTLRAMDVAGNSSTQNLSFVRHDVGLTMDSLTDDQLNQPSVNVTGFIDDSNAVVIVNGVTATISGDPVWEADGVPVSSTGTAVFNVQVYDGGSNLVVLQNFARSQPATVMTASHFDNESWVGEEGNLNHYLLNWLRNIGGTFAFGQDDDPDRPSGTVDASDPWGPPWFVLSSLQPSIKIDNISKSTVMIAPSDQVAPGGTALYLVSVQAWPCSIDYPHGWQGDLMIQTNEQFSAAALKIQGLTPVATTNADGSVWDRMIIQTASGANTPLMLTAPVSHAFDAKVGELKLQSLTVVSNSATQIGSTTNWAVVKTATNDYVIVQAVLSDTNAIFLTNAIIQWTGGEAVPNNPWQRRVTKTNSVETTVTASLGSTNVSLDVWVIWATVENKTTGTTPANAVQYGTRYDGTENLGPQTFVDDDSQIAAVGKIVPIATITPSGIHNILTNNWSFKREKFRHDFLDGIQFPGRWDTNWVDDTSLPDFQHLVPDNDDKIYDRDAPNIRMPGAGVNNSWERYDNFHEWITWNGVDCSTKEDWYWKAWWKVDQNPQITLKELNASQINPLPDSPHYSAP